MSVLGHSYPADERAGTGFRLIAPIFSTVFVGMLWWVGLRPFVSQMAADLGVSVPLVGQVVTLGALLTALAGLFTGPVADHYGHRRSIVIGLNLLALSTALYAAAPNIYVMAIGGIVGGLGMAMTYGVAFAVVSTHFSSDDRRHAVGMTQAAASFAVVAGPPILVAIAATFVWRGAFASMSVALVVAGLIAARFLPPDERPEGRCASPRRILSNYKPLLASPPVRMLFLVSMMRSVIVTGLGVYLGSFYFDVIGFSAGTVGIAFMLEGTGQMLGSLAGGGRIGGFNQRRTFSVGTVLIGTGALTVYTVQPGPLATVGIAIAMAFVAGVTFTSLTAMLAGESPVGAATTMVLNISMIAVGAGVGSAFGGALIGLGGYRSIGIAAAAIALTAATLVHASSERSAAPERSGQAA
ncbi:MAG: MFS transporter [Thermomicrobiales bacterium]